MFSFFPSWSFKSFPWMKKYKDKAVTEEVEEGNVPSFRPSSWDFTVIIISNIKVLLMIRNFVTVTLLWISLDSLGILSSGTSFSSPQYSSSLFPCITYGLGWEWHTFLGRFIPCLVLRMNPSADQKSPVVGKTASGAYRWIYEKKKNTEKGKGDTRHKKVSFGRKGINITHESWP